MMMLIVEVFAYDIAYVDIARHAQKKTGIDTDVGCLGHIILSIIMITINTSKFETYCQLDVVPVIYLMYQLKKLNQFISR